MSEVRAVLVTGAAGGIGRAVSARLATEGYTVVLNDVAKPQGLQDLAEAIQVRGGHAIVIEGNITVDREREHIVESLPSPIYALVHCAVAPLEEKWFLRTQLEAFERHWDVAVRAPVCLLQHLMPGMIEVRRGSIVWILTSATIGVPPRQMSAYLSAKMAAWGLIRALAVEYASKNVRINAVSPGFTETALTSGTPPAIRDLYRKAVPMGRLATPEDTAAAVSFLVSDEAAFVTGVNLPVCGGSVLT